MSTHQIAVTAGLALLVFVVAYAFYEAVKRRGIDPIGDFVRMFDPSTPPTPSPA